MTGLKKEKRGGWRSALEESKREMKNRNARRKKIARRISILVKSKG